MNPVKAFVSLLASLLLSGCVSFSSYPKPTTDTKSELTALAPWLSADVLTAYAAKSGADKRAYRDDVLNARIRAVNLRFTEFVQRLDEDRRRLNVGTDWTVIALNGTASLVTPNSTKSILSAISGGVVGAKGSVDKNLFFDKTMPVLIAQMEANRRDVLVKIRTGMNQDTDHYPLTNGLIDVEDYYTAGSLNGAITAIGASSGDTIKQADQKLKQAAESDYVEDDAGKLLLNFWRPKGVVNKDNEAALNAWLKKNNLEGEIIPYFIQAADYSTQREKAAKDLNLKSR